jgi:hypothetical protein
MGLELLSKQLEIQMLILALNQMVTDQVTESISAICCNLKNDCKPKIAKKSLLVNFFA